MGVLPDKERSRIQRILAERMRSTVRLAFFTHEVGCPACREAKGLLEEVTSASEKVSLEAYDIVKDSAKAEAYGIDKIPGLAVLGRNREYGVRFFGAPSGYEFHSLLESIIDASTGTTALTPEARRRLQGLTVPLHIQVFVTLTCPYCPKAVRLAHQMAVESEKVRADMVDITEFPHLAQRHAVLSVPKVVINDKVEFVGALPDAHFLQHVLLAAGPPRTMYT